MPARLRLRASAVLLALVSGFAVLTTTTAPAANAMTSYQYNVLHEAARHKGAAYQWGAVGPRRFDCSGYTLYVFSRFGKKLPHNSASQYSAVRHVSKSSRQPGDLIFYRNSSGRIYHVGIYAGSNRIWHAPHSGSYVKLAAIYTSNYVVGRV